MGFLLQAVILCVILLAISRYFISQSLKSPPQLPETWWTPGTEKDADEKIRPFNIKFSEEVICY